MVLGSEQLDVLVVGAGQAGLAAARALQETGIRTEVHERHARVGDSWRKRYDSLVLFTPRQYSALPGLPLRGDPEGFPTKDEIGDYLEEYARHFRLPIVAGSGIARLERRDAEFRALTASGRELRACAVIVTTGAFQEPTVPRFAASLAADVIKLHAQSYRNPSSLPEGEVLVVGDGATGRQIALELTSFRPVTLAMGRHRHIVPQRMLGRDLAWWSDVTGSYWADKETWLGRRVRSADAFPGLHLRAAALRRAGINLRPRALGAQGDEVTFADGSRRRVRTVIWAVGYRDDTSWMAVPKAVAETGFVQDRGLTRVPGLFHVGREWQNNRASALICGVHRDARRMVELLKGHLSRQTTGRSCYP